MDCTKAYMSALNGIYIIIKYTYKNSHIYTMLNATFLNALHAIPSITQTLHSLGSIHARRHFTSAHIPATLTFTSYQVPI